MAGRIPWLPSLTTYVPSNVPGFRHSISDPFASSPKMVSKSSFSDSQSSYTSSHSKDSTRSPTRPTVLSGRGKDDFAACPFIPCLVMLT